MSTIDLTATHFGVHMGWQWGQLQLPSWGHACCISVTS